MWKSHLSKLNLVEKYGFNQRSDFFSGCRKALIFQLKSLFLLLIVSISVLFWLGV